MAESPILVTHSDGTNHAPAGDAPARALAIVPSIPGTIVTGEAHAAATQNVATLAAAANVTTYLAGFAVTGLGATSASAITVLVSDGTWTLRFIVAVPAGATTGITPLIHSFPIPLAASAANTTNTVTVPSFGTGNTSAQAMAWGFQK